MPRPSPAKPKAQPSAPTTLRVRPGDLDFVFETWEVGEETCVAHVIPRPGADAMLDPAHAHALFLVTFVDLMDRYGPPDHPSSAASLDEELQAFGDGPCAIWDFDDYIVTICVRTIDDMRRVELSTQPTP